MVASDGIDVKVAAVLSKGETAVTHSGCSELLAVGDAVFQLSQDAAGNLQNQCTELDQRLSSIEEMAIQNDFSAPILATDSGDTPMLLVDDLDYAILADWKYKEE